MTKDDVLKLLAQTAATILAGMQAYPHGGVNRNDAIEHAMWIIEKAEVYAESWEADTKEVADED